MGAGQTLVLGRDDIVQTMRLADYIDAVERAFAEFAGGRMAVPGVVHIAAPDGAFHVKSAAFVEEPAWVAVKVNGNFPGNRQKHGLPTIQGAIVLCDGRTGSLLAVIDSIEVTAMRTGAASAVAAKYLARPDAAVATIVGCGIQGRVQLLALAAVLPLQKVFAFDSDAGACERFVRGMREETGLDVCAAEDLADATLASDVIATCTSSRSAYLRPEHVVPGTFIAAVGADNHDKQELAPELMAAGRLVVDVMEQCATFGELHHAIASGVMQRADVYADLGSIVASGARPEFGPDEIVIFDSTGSAIQDVAAAGIIYERARAAGMGLSVGFA